MEREFTAVFEKRGRWYVAYVEEVPGVNTQGRTLAEARRNLREALRLVLETNRQLAAAHARDVRREPITVRV
ncbi:MAG: HicB family protein [Acidobacteria bacterium]|nr:MAG: HicB family protein [Acidobacteriota bacterium]